MATVAKNENENLEKNYRCFFCNFFTCKKTDYERHIKTTKHLSNESATLSNNEATKKTIRCENCNKIYNDRTGLWRHKKICNKLETIANEEHIKKFNESEIKSTTSSLPHENSIENCSLPEELSDPSILQIIMMLVKDNSEFKKIMAEQSASMIEIAKNSCNQSHNNNNNNNNNKTFNLQFFLNETCKNAMNINEFIQQLKIEVEDLENMGNVGYVQGISNIINKNMNTLDVTERPIHCSDLKRGTIHIKDNNVWEKDDQENTLTRKAISKISTKTIVSMKKFREKYPDCESYSSRHSNKYNKICREVCGGEGDNVLEKNNKIIHNIIKKVVVEKIKDE
jgi:hypothetical protein